MCVCVGGGWGAVQEARRLLAPYEPTTRCDATALGFSRACGASLSTEGWEYLDLNGEGTFIVRSKVDGKRRVGRRPNSVYQHGGARRGPAWPVFGAVFMM